MDARHEVPDGVRGSARRTGTGTTCATTRCPHSGSGAADDGALRDLRHAPRMRRSTAGSGDVDAAGHDHVVGSAEHLEPAVASSRPRSGVTSHPSRSTCAVSSGSPA